MVVILKKEIKLGYIYFIVTKNCTMNVNQLYLIQKLPDEGERND